MVDGGVPLQPTLLSLCEILRLGIASKITNINNTLGVSEFTKESCFRSSLSLRRPFSRLTYKMEWLLDDDGAAKTVSAVGVSCVGVM